MDSVTQVALGASLAAVCVPAEHRRKAVLVGAMLGTLPDLDVFIDYGDAVSNFTFHRGFSHSLFTLIPFSIGLWAVLKRFWQPVMDAPKGWFWAIVLALVTHPLLDAHTAYGTQLFWPVDSPPVMWSTLFIIDPLYTLPLLIGMLVILISPSKTWAKKTLSVGIVLSTLYLGWSWVGKTLTHQAVAERFPEAISEGRVFSTPTPFNSILWRVVVLDDENYYEGFYSVLKPEEGVAYTQHAKNLRLFEVGRELWSVKQLEWFASGFNKAEVMDDQLVVTDLRMGFEGNYVFRHVVANIGNPHPVAIESTRLEREFDGDDLDEFWVMLKAAF